MEPGAPLPFALLQTRIGRKNITKKQLQDAPIAFFAYDLLEYNSEDWRSRTLEERRNKLEEILLEFNQQTIILSPVIHFTDWNELATLRETSRDIGAEGIMLKRKTSIYQVGRKRGDWWKWKIDPLTIDAVMIYAQKGSGRRSNLYTDYTFAVKDGDKLVSFTKAYSGLTDKEFAQVDNFVKRNSLEKFGPVRTVKPELVFEIAFEGIAASNRHKSGVALRFPRMVRWRKDKKPDDINTLEDLKKMLEIPLNFFYQIVTISTPCSTVRTDEFFAGNIIRCHRKYFVRINHYCAVFFRTISPGTNNIIRVYSFCSQRR